MLILLLLILLIKIIDKINDIISKIVKKSGLLYLLIMIILLMKIRVMIEGGDNLFISDEPPPLEHQLLKTQECQLTEFRVETEDVVSESLLNIHLETTYNLPAMRMQPHELAQVETDDCQCHLIITTDQILT